MRSATVTFFSDLYFRPRSAQENIYFSSITFTVILEVWKCYSIGTLSDLLKWLSSVFLSVWGSVAWPGLKADGLCFPEILKSPAALHHWQVWWLLNIEPAPSTL